MPAKARPKVGDLIPALCGLLALCAFVPVSSRASEPPAGAGPSSTARPTKNFVIIVANNRSLTPGVAPLHYADDDGARWYELLAPAAARISLFTVLDEESQRIFRTLTPLAESPTVPGVLARVAEYNAEMESARAGGFEPVLYFIVVGHGEVTPDGEGYVSLLDAPLGRGQIFRDVIAPSKAAFNHVIIDACNAYLLVARRGEDRGQSGADAIRRYVADEDLDRYPTTGVVLSTSRAQATHEWSVYGGGIFSHQLRSALAGAADSNGDGRIEYSEVAAFIASANLKVDDARARLDVFVRAPRIDRNRPLLDLVGARFEHFLRLPQAASGRYWLEDERGVRYADINKSPEREVLLALAPARRYFLRTDASEASFSLVAPGTIVVSPEQLSPRARTARGNIEESFQRHLFEVPFGPAFYRGFVASNNEAPVAEPPAALFAPPPVASAPALEKGAIAVRAAAVRARLQAIGLRVGDDPFADTLRAWSTACLGANNLREADRAIEALERRADGAVIEKTMVQKKLERLRARVHASVTSGAIDSSLSAAALALDHDDAPEANRLLNAAIDHLDQSR